MRQWIVTLLIVGCLCAPGLAFARSAEAGTETRLAASSLEGDILGIPKEEAVVVGAGIIAGALVLHLMVPGDFTYFAGGVVGGLAALWWYDKEHGKQRPMLKVDRAGAVVDPRGGSALEGAALNR